MEGTDKTGTGRDHGAKRGQSQDDKSGEKREGDGYGGFNELYLIEVREPQKEGVEHGQNPFSRAFYQDKAQAEMPQGINDLRADGRGEKKKEPVKKETKAEQKVDKPVEKKQVEERKESKK